MSVDGLDHVYTEGGVHTRETFHFPLLSIPESYAYGDMMSGMYFRFGELIILFWIEAIRHTWLRLHMFTDLPSNIFGQSLSSSRSDSLSQLSFPPRPRDRQAPLISRLSLAASHTTEKMERNDHSLP